MPCASRALKVRRQCSLNKQCSLKMGSCHQRGKLQRSLFSKLFTDATQLSITSVTGIHRRSGPGLPEVMNLTGDLSKVKLAPKGLYPQDKVNQSKPIPNSWDCRGSSAITKKSKRRKSNGKTSLMPCGHWPTVLDKHLVYHKTLG